MKAAISTDGIFVSAHFGRCPEFTIVDIRNNVVEKKETVQNPGHQAGLIPQFMKDKGVDLMICGGMGQRAKMLFDEFGIQAVVGITGSIEDAIKSLLEGILEGGDSLCAPGAGKGYGVEKAICDHPEDKDC
ncbi:MAG: NifB/NifX family molybdenum-iron cluster-binding protein [Candidatus Theseobacter exili]|nr:NifB/NifX family molybdenum-iron cluster-binding protein [Candidatus Theseobacter exili]